MNQSNTAPFCSTLEQGSLPAPALSPAPNQDALLPLLHSASPSSSHRAPAPRHFHPATACYRRQRNCELGSHRRGVASSFSSVTQQPSQLSSPPSRSHRRSLRRAVVPPAPALFHLQPSIVLHCSLSPSCASSALFCAPSVPGTASLHSQPPKASPLLTQFLNTSTTILHLKQTQAFALKLLSHQPHQYNHFLGRLFLRILRLNVEISNLCYAHKLVDEMPNCPNSFLWTSLIRAFISGTQFRHGISTYARMHQNGVLPSEFTYSTVLNACGRILATFEGTQVHARVVQSGFLGNKFVQTALLDMYAKFGSVFDARVVFDGMCDTDLVAWTAMICGYTKAGMMIHARWLFDNMGEKNSFTWTTMVAGYANSGDMKSAKKLYDAMDEENKSVVTWVAMIAGYGKFGNVSEAKRVFDRISTPRYPSACAAMLACYAQNGYAKEAIDMYKEMRQSKIKITEVAMVGALSACAQLRDIQMSSTLTEHVEESIYDRICIISNSLIHMHSKCGNINLAWTEFS
ncbi:hypothetical protein S245_017920 [Arachis hypogaea]